MLHIVSGYMRSGTSMMMETLEAGGMEAVYSTSRSQELNEKWGEPSYTPNDNYYELAPEEYSRRDFQKHYDGKLIKLLCGGMLDLPPGEYRIIIMRRNINAIRDSCLAAFHDDISVRNIIDLDRRLDDITDILRDRRSVKTVDAIRYEELISNPHAILSSLQWPIDVARAAKVPRKSHARFNERAC